MFIQAQPIWLKGKEREMNTYAVFSMKANIETGAELHITGASFYRVFANGVFIGFGPARTASGYAREDIFRLDDFGPKCEIVIEAVGYYCHSLSTVFQPSYLLAEIQWKGKALACTSNVSEGFQPGCKLQQVERYSVQRHFCEVWDYRDCCTLTDAAYCVPVEVVSDMPQILNRRVPFPKYEDVMLTNASCTGTLTYDESLLYRDQYSWDPIPEEWGYFKREQITYRPYIWLQRQKQTITGGKQELPLNLQKGEYAIFDFGQIEAGFLKISVEALMESDVTLGFCEYYPGDTFDFGTINAHNGIEYFFGKGDQREVMSFEPYTFRYAIVAVKEGSLRLRSFGVKTYMFDISNLTWRECGRETLDSICCGAIRTFAHNSVDLYMDCPSRERAGWLCDSYFTAKTEYALTGETKVEDAFLENYRLYENNGEYPKGMLPMCYPSDKKPDEELFIPQWTMWYILEAEEYIHKRGHGDMAEDFRESIYGLLEFYRKYENEEGLLERLPGWNFVEWSDANQWTWDVNYPTNFLYAQVLECIGKLYGDEECRRRSEEVRRTAVEQSFNGRYFMDHAVRDEQGKLRLEMHSSEACQYYAVLFGGIDIHTEEFKELEHLVLHVFNPNRDGAMPEIMEVNAFIGAYLRLEALCKLGEYQLLLKDVESFFARMEACTGTLWEYRDRRGSLDHGFASYALVVIQEACKHIPGLTT